MTVLLKRWGNLGPEKLGEGTELTLESRVECRAWTHSVPTFEIYCQPRVQMANQREERLQAKKGRVSLKTLEHG